MKMGKLDLPAGKSPKTVVKIRPVEEKDEKNQPYDPKRFKYRVYVPGNPDQILSEDFDNEEDALEFIRTRPEYLFTP